MSELVLHFDWATTPLGQVATWPDRLRAAVEACLAAGLPALVCWGPGRTVIYNDAAIPLLGSAHPDALGRSIDGLDADLWREAGRQARKVQATGRAATWFVEDPPHPADPEDGRVAFSGTPLCSADGGIAGVWVTAFGATERVRREHVVRENEQRLRQALQIGRLAIFDQDVQTGEFVWTEEVFRMLGYEPGEVKPSYDAFASRIHPDDRRIMEAAAATARTEHRLYSHSYRVVLPGGELRWCSVDGQYFYDHTGAAVRVLGVMQDTTERHHYEQTQRLLIAELQHRTRNLLAVVQAVAAKTLRRSHSLDQFGADFNSRLQALGRVQTLLSSDEGLCPTLRELVLSELSAHGASIDDGRVLVEGPEVSLSTAAVQLLALTIHELATNALKYGALGQQQARLSVTWSTVPAGHQKCVTIRWAEEMVTLRQEPPRRNGFGRELIERALPRGLGARTRFELAADGVRCEISLPI